MPAFKQVAADLRSKIESGEYGSEGKLPSNAQLRKAYSVSNTVIRDAINELRQAGLVVGQQGKGVYVTSATMLASSAEPAGIEDRLQVIEERVNSLRENDVHDLRRDVQDLRHDVGVLRTSIIDLYVRMGLPYPQELTVSGAEENKEPDAEPIDRSA